VETELSKRGQLHTQLVYALTRAVAEARDVEDIFEAALTCLGASVGTSRLSILLFGEDDRMHFVASRGLSADYQAAVDGHSPWARDALSPGPILVADLDRDDSLAALREVIAAEGIRSLAFIPLLAGTRLIGKFMVYYDAPHEFDAAEVMAAETIAAQVAFAVDHQERRSENERLAGLARQMIDAIGIAVYSTDADGLITHFNEAAAEMWGRRPEIGVDQWCGSWRIFTTEGDPVALADCPMGVALREQRSIRGVEIVVEGPDGSRKTVMPYPTPLHDHSGRLIGAVNALVDITEPATLRRTLQETLLAKDDFLGQVSHELRTPLTQVMGNAHLLVRRWDALDEETRRESVHEIMAHSQRMHRLVNNMLVLSRLERGVLPQTEPQLLQRLLGTTIDEFSLRFPDTALEVDIAPELPPVSTTADTIDQVVWNLMTNARKYGPRSGPVRLTARATPGWAEVRVTDQGPGVSEADRERLFEPYFRSSATAAQAGGLGLGLSVCKTLIEAQGGSIWALPLEERGMEFGFRLPALG
jgi:PAS domain S-box-containing protein